ncbi:MAG: GAF domain-containing protein [Lachnospiraceae bacterium]|nr:GAF domain-containing protein [Lachnospiraceae bacterium]
MDLINRDVSVDSLIKIALDLSAEKNFNVLMQKILSEAMRICRCDAGTVYIAEKDHLDFYTVCTRSKGILLGKSDNADLMPPVPLDRRHVCACAVMDNRKINIPDIYSSKEYDFAGAQRYDSMNGYKTVSMLVIPMEDEKGKVIGVLQLINALDEEGRIIPFDKCYETIVSALASLAAVSINNHRLAETVTGILHSFVSVMVDAIDTRSSYNANHTRSMAKYAKKFVNWLNSTDNTWKFEEEKKDPFFMSVWLHDIGKLLVPLEVLDKPDRLGRLRDGIKSKLEMTKLSCELQKAQDPGSAEKYSAKVDALNKAWDLIDSANRASFVDDATIHELEECAGIPCITAYGKSEPLLNSDELDAITVQKGTLTASEREKVEEHVSYTARMLGSMSFTGVYESVPVWAGSHHEFLNGTGYPNHLTADEIPKETRLITIIDIYDALTAEDRPYKPPVPTEKAFEILEDMGREGRIDTEILALFKESGAWRK